MSKMTKLTEHFTVEEMSRSEAAIRLGIDNTCPVDLLPNMLRVANALEVIRERLTSIKGRNVPIHVTSCYRGPEVNKAVGGSPTSAHRFASAADCEAEGFGILELCRIAAEVIPDYDQIIYEFGESGWMHIGFAKVPRKQKLTATKKDGKTVYSQGF